MPLFGGSAQDDVDLRDLQERVARLEQTVARLEAQLASGGAAPAGAAAPGGDGLDEVRRLKAEGNLIAAIKAYRAVTHVGLAEAKNAVERMP